MAVELDTNGNGAIDIEKGGTNATSAVQALSNLGGQPYDADLDILSSGSFSQKRALIEAFAKPVLGVDALRTTMADFDGDCRYLAYHTASGDGGHGTFCWDAASTDADDDQDTIAVTGVSTGRWKRNIDPITGELSTHINRTTVHGSTDAPTPGSIVQRDVNGCSSFAPGTEQSHAVVLGQLAAAVLSQIMSSFDGDFSNPNAGWIKFPNGLMVQWGVYLSGIDAAVTHSWPVEFPDGCFAAVGQIRNQSATHESTITVINAGSETFGLYGYARQYSCFVIGIGYDNCFWGKYKNW